MTKRCADLIAEKYKDRLDQFKKGLKTKDPMNWIVESVLGFDYVEPKTFKDQKEGYWRMQISWGGPSDEVRWYTNNGINFSKTTYAYLDWFDGDEIEIDDDVWDEIQMTLPPHCQSLPDQKESY
tara:strand:+ start:293 stop:664 length:372 start_codon:yes stop_codon:yes gene_type:complete